MNDAVSPITTTPEIPDAEPAERMLDDDLVSDSAVSIASSELAEPAPPSTTGGQLRAARMAAGLSVSDIAEVLRFSAHQIEALERDDYAHLAGSTLVRGMVRGYAKLLKIKAEPLLAGLDSSIKSTAADVRAPTNIGVADKATTVTRLSYGAIIAMVIFALLFAAVAGYVYLMTDEPLVKAAVMAETMPSTPVAQAMAPPAIAASQNVASLATNVPAQEPVIAPGNTLVVDFDGLSWVEIADASQSIVFRGEFPKGTHQVVDGKPPFQLWIGRASSVRVSFGERVIDLKPYSRDNVARLTVE